MSESKPGVGYTLDFKLESLKLVKSVQVASKAGTRHGD